MGKPRTDVKAQSNDVTAIGKKYRREVNYVPAYIARGDSASGVQGVSSIVADARGLNRFGVTALSGKAKGTSFAGRSGKAKGTSFAASAVDIHIEGIKKGYPIKRFNSLKDYLGLNSKEVAKLANISLATIHRRKTSGHLTPDESEKIYRLEKLHTIAREVMGNDNDSVKSWFNTPQTVFGGKKPLEYAETLPGCEEIERVLRRMEQGIIL
jgi:putative toxin-antitoxin system antitoxin component (TIGR02293 family)